MNAYFSILWLQILFVCGERYEVSNDNAEGNQYSCVYATDECPNADITFWLYKNDSQQDAVQLNPLSLVANDFDSHVSLKILIHGFKGSRHLSPNREIRPALLQNMPVQVISLDYAPLVHLPCYYPWAIYNAHIVGKCLAQLIDNLISNEIYTRDQIHVIGFSLGGQIAGLTANYAKYRLKRITGLDPARPAFVTINKADKLDATDADFVDVLHTDPLLYGMLQPSGHADFYPNFGAMAQTGCSYWQEGRLINCNHFRAPIYYAESITSHKGFWSYHCGSWWEFLLQRCNKYGHRPLAKMGYFVGEDAVGAYFLNTYPKAPFAQGIPIDLQIEIFANASRSEPRDPAMLNKGSTY